MSAGTAGAAGEQVVGRLGVDHRSVGTGTEGIAPDAVRCQLERDVLHQPDHAVLAET